MKEFYIDMLNRQSNISHYGLKVAVMAVLLLLVAACSTTKHVPDGELLLDDVTISIDDCKKCDIKSENLFNYLRQTPNHKVLGGMKLQLGFYNLSGSDTTKWFNKWVRRVGSAPEIYDHSLTEASVKQLRMALENKGYMDAEVTYDTVARPEKKKMKVNYHVRLNEPHYVASITYNIPNDTVRNIVMADSSLFLVHPNSLLDRSVLDQERQMISERLRNRGYYAFSKEYISFLADTTAGSNEVKLTMNVRPPFKNDKMPYYTVHRPFYVRNVVVVTNYNPVTMHSPKDYWGSDTVQYKGFTILYDGYHYLRPGVLEENCFIEPGRMYRASDVSRTYEAFSRLEIEKSVNIEFQPVGEADGRVWLDAYVLITRGKSQTVSLSLEGTNSEGDLGFGVGAGYSHRNLFRGSEVLNAKFRASYESISGDLSGLINDNYSEYSGEIGLTYPKFKAPFLKKDFKRKILASTEFATRYNYQARPEYTRIIAGASWKYIWSERTNNTRHTLNLLDLNYVYLPESKLHFLDDITNPLLRYSYEDHFIMRMGYSYYHSNKSQNVLMGSYNQPDVFTIRAAVETSGNLLYGVSNLIGQDKDDDAYKVFGIRYAQYAKANADYSITHNFNPKSSISYHVGAGVAVPYGNSNVLPFEKRFYAGGANSVRGWGVRTLGPGSYSAANLLNSFIYQCGDIRLDMNLEYRAKLFWVIELGAFIDAGNIWTIKDYEDQPGGVFKFNEFYKQIALAYGLGLRLDFTYFLLRFDLGMKAHNPAEGQERWPIVNPKFSRDATFHFSVGYPF